MFRFKFRIQQKEEKMKMHLSYESDSDIEEIPCDPESSSDTSENVAGDLIEEDESDWRKNTQDKKNGLFGYALKHSKLTDIVLKVGPEATPFKAHKLILAFGSPVFESMFYGSLAEQGTTVSIPDLMPDGFDLFLNHLYGNAAHPENEMQAFHTWIAADKYCVPALKREMETYFQDLQLSSSNVWLLLENALALKLRRLVSRCKRFLKHNTESSLRDASFLETSTETLSCVLELDLVDTTELILLKCVVHWGRHKVQSGDARSLREALEPFLEFIRFGALTAVDFCKFLNEVEDLLSECEALAVLRHLTMPIVNPLPSWCCKKLWERDPLTHSSPKRRKVSTDDYQANSSWPPWQVEDI